MYCKKCGTELREGDEFCYYCGERTGFFQRVFSSKAMIGSMIALAVVALAGVLTYFIWTGKLHLPSKGGQVVTDHKDADGSGKTPSEGNKPAETPEPTATPYVFQPSDVTEQKKTEMKPLTDRLMPFLAYSASFYADGSHAFRWDDASATTMALYNLEHYDQTVKYGDSMETIQKKAKKEMKKLFGSNYEYDFKYEGTYPGYVYRPTGDTMVFNATRIPGKEYHLKVEKIMGYEEGKFRLVVEAYLSVVTDGTKGDSQKYTVTVEEDENAEYGYVVEKIKLKK